MKPRLPIIMYITAILAIEAGIFDAESVILRIIVPTLIAASYVLVIMRPQYSWHLFFAITVVAIATLSITPIPTSTSLILSVLIIAFMIIYLTLNGLLDVRVLTISLITLASSLLLVDVIMRLLGRVFIPYVGLLGINLNYFLIILASSLSILVLFILVLALKGLVRRAMAPRK